MVTTLQAIQNLPKVLLHDHLDGGLRAQTIIDLAGEMKISLPKNDAQQLANWFYTESTAKNLQRCLDSFAVSCAVMQTEAALERVAYETIADLALDNVIYVETRFCPELHVQNGLSYRQIIDSVIRGLNRGRNEFGVEYGILLCGMYDFADEINLKIAEMCAEYLGNGVVGYDFAGVEIDDLAIKQAKTLQLLNTAQIRLTAHAGELIGINPIVQALDVGAKRLGHVCMIYTGGDAELIEQTIQRIIKQNVHIEINILSNLATGAISDVARHPVKQLFDRGISLALNTDDRLMFNNSLSGEYFALAEAHDISLADIRKMNINAIKASFASQAIKDKIHKQLLHYEPLA